VAGVALVGALGASACGDDDSGPTLSVYSGRHYDVELAFERFEEETGVNVEFLTGNDAELRERIAAEGEDTEADVYLTVDAGNLATAAADGLFQPLASPVLTDAIPPAYRDPDDLWFGLAVRVRTIVFNRDRIDRADVPTSYEELAEPQWEGRVCMRTAASTYQQSLVASLIATDGEAAARTTLEGWTRNATIYANDIEILEAMASGECEVGITNHYYLARMIEEDPDFPVELIWANQETGGVHVNISGGGVTTHADQPELARQFLEWLGTDGQDVLVATNHEYPANGAVAPEPLIAERFGNDFVGQQVGAADYGRLNADAVRLMDDVGFG
jgi:iron(III) transport system substrate-binding protein